MLQVWGHGDKLDVEANINCIPVIYRRYAEGSHVLQGKFAYFISSWFGRSQTNSDYLNWLDSVTIPRIILENVTYGKAIIVADDTTESLSSKDLGPTLERFTKRNTLDGKVVLDSSNFVFSTNNINFPKQTYCDVYSAPFVLEYCKYAIIDKDPDFYNAVMQQRGKWEYPFISIAGEPRQHRRILHNMIREHWSDSGICCINKGFRSDNYSDIEYVPEQSPYEKEQQDQPFNWHMINPQHYIHIPCAAVMETHINYERAGITEKPFKNLVYPQPFVLLAAKGLIKHMRQLGFNFYDKIVDHSYDEIADDLVRTRAVFESFKKLVDSPTDLVYEREVVEHNRNVCRNLTIAQDFINYLRKKLT